MRAPKWGRDGLLSRGSHPRGTDAATPPAPTIAGMTKKRGYSRDFTPRTERRCYLMIDKIPATLHDKVKAKAKREGVSLRSLVLGWLKDWADKP